MPYSTGAPAQHAVIQELIAPGSSKGRLELS